MSAWARDASSGGVGASEVACVGLDFATVAGRGNTASFAAAGAPRSSQLVVPSFDAAVTDAAATRACSAATRQCRTSVSLAFRAAADAPLDALEVGGEVSLDGGAHWSSARASGSRLGALALGDDGAFAPPGAALSGG